MKRMLLIAALSVATMFNANAYDFVLKFLSTDIFFNGFR